MAEHREDIKVGAKTEGFGPVQQALRSLEQAGTKAAQGQAKGFGAAQKALTAYKDTLHVMETQLQKLSKRQLDTVVALESTEKGTKAYEGLTNELKRLNDESTKINRVMGTMKRAYKEHTKVVEDAEKAQKAFRQGLLQGMIPEVANLNRGPGMYRQAAGGFIGRRIRGGAGRLQQAGMGLGGSPFTGSAGISQALRAIPGVGDFLAGQMQTTMGMAGQAIGAERSRLGLSMFMGGGMGAQITKAERSARARALREVPAADLSPGAIQDEVEARSQQRADYIESKLGKTLGSVEKTLQGWFGSEERAQEADRKELQSNKVNARSFANRQALRAGNRVRGRVINPLRSAGTRFLAGGEQEAIQAAAGIMQAGGGGIGDLQQQGMLQAGLAAQTRYGLGADVSGAFLQAGRRGGLAGGGRADTQMTRTIADAMSMGLEGSEINDYLRTVASGIQEWKQTGIPFNRESLAGMGKELAKTGLGGIRGAAIAQGMQGAAKRVGMGGVQSGTDLLLMQSLTGYKGGGAADYEQALMDLEEGNFKKGGLQSLFKNVMGMGGGNKAAGRMLFTDVMRQKFGVQIGRREVGALQRSLSGEATTADKQRMAEVEQQMGAGKAAAPQNVADLLRQAESSVQGWAGGAKALATVQNQQIDIGKKMLPVMINFERQAESIATSFANFAGGPLKQFTDNTAELAEAVKRASSNMSWLVGE